MFERFSPAARNVPASAHAEARDMRHGHIGTEHLLVALATEPEVAALALDAERLRAEVVRTVGLGDAEPPSGNSWLPFTAAAKEALEAALAEAMQLGRREVEPAHILLSVLKQRDGVARRILVGAGATPSEFREAVIRRLKGVEPDEDVMALLAIVERRGPVADWLRERGVGADDVRTGERPLSA
jgi:ATP-dependent Clp protease ATP-binding subunit ClpA